MNAQQPWPRVVLKLVLVLPADFTCSGNTHNTELSGADKLELGRLTQWSAERDHGGYIR